MEGSSTDNYFKEVCDLKHKTMDDSISDLKDQVEEVVNPSSGHISKVRAELEALIDKKIESVNAKINGLIMFFMTTAVGIAIAIGGEFIKKFLK